MTNGSPSLKALASFKDLLADVEASGGVWVPPAGSDSDRDAGRLGYWVHSEILIEFVKMLYREAWVDRVFEWKHWKLQRDAFISDKSRIRLASPSDLQKLLTSIVRSERFKMGYLEERLRDDTLHAIAERAAYLSRE